MRQRCSVALRLSKETWMSGSWMRGRKLGLSSLQRASPCEEASMVAEEAEPSCHRVCAGGVCVIGETHQLVELAMIPCRDSSMVLRRENAVTATGSRPSW